MTLTALRGLARKTQQHIPQPANGVVEICLRIGFLDVQSAENVVVVGAGPAGTRAAEVLSAHGVRPTVIDEAPRSGGQIYRRPPSEVMRPGKTLYGFEARRAESIHKTFDALQEGIDYCPETTVWDVDGNALHVMGPAGIGRRHWSRLILASGAMDCVLPFPGWDIPGVFSLGGSQVALKYQSCAVGSKPVFFGTGPLLYLVAYQYAKAGIDVQAVLDTAPPLSKIQALPGLATGGSTFLKGIYYVAALRARGIKIRGGVRPLAAVAGSGGAVQSFRWRDLRQKEHETACDAVAFGFALRSETQLADLCGAEFTFNQAQRQWLPAVDDDGRASVPGVYLAGDGASIRGADAAELAGRRAAFACLLDMGRLKDRAELDRLNARLRRFERFRKSLDGVAFPFPHDIAVSASDDLMVCRCEGITAGAIRGYARSLGAHELNRAKAFTRIGMGRCQGRICGPAAAEILADSMGRSIDRVGRLRGQAPVKPVSMTALAEAETP